jgi:hypothetical protein
VKGATTGVMNIRVIVAGTVKQPRISLESDAQPPISQSDLLSYLAFGESSGSLLQFGGTGSGLQGGNVLNMAGTRLMGMAVGVGLDQLEGSTARSLGLDVFSIQPGDFPSTIASSGINQFLRGTEIEAGRYLNPNLFVSAIATPGLFSCAGGNRENSSCAVPGLTFQYRTGRGLRFETSLTPRYILFPPTLAGQSAAGTSQFGAFLVREWRF